MFRLFLVAISIAFQAHSEQYTRTQKVTKEKTYDGDTFESIKGSAIQFTGSSLTVLSSQFTKCSTEKYGAAICADNPSGEVVIKNTNFTECISTLIAGAIYCNVKSFTIDNCIIKECSASDSESLEFSSMCGGCYLMSVEDSILNNTHFLSCSADICGALSVWSQGTVKIANSLFEKCSATKTGAGIMVGDKDMIVAGTATDLTSCVANYLEKNKDSYFEVGMACVAAPPLSSWFKKYTEDGNKDLMGAIMTLPFSDAFRKEILDYAKAHDDQYLPAILHIFLNETIFNQISQSLDFSGTALWSNPLIVLPSIMVPFLNPDLVEVFKPLSNLDLSSTIEQAALYLLNGDLTKEYLNYLKLHDDSTFLSILKPIFNEEIFKQLQDTLLEDPYNIYQAASYLISEATKAISKLDKDKIDPKSIIKTIMETDLFTTKFQEIIKTVLDNFQTMFNGDSKLQANDASQGASESEPFSPISYIGNYLEMLAPLLNSRFEQLIKDVGDSDKANKDLVSLIFNPTLSTFINTVLPYIHILTNPIVSPIILPILKKTSPTFLSPTLDAYIQQLESLSDFDLTFIFNKYFVRVLNTDYNKIISNLVPFAVNWGTVENFADFQMDSILKEITEALKNPALLSSTRFHSNSLDLGEYFPIECDETPDPEPITQKFIAQVVKLVAETFLNEDVLQPVAESLAKDETFREALIDLVRAVLQSYTGDTILPKLTELLTHFDIKNLDMTVISPLLSDTLKDLMKDQQTLDVTVLLNPAVSDQVKPIVDLILDTIQQFLGKFLGDKKEDVLLHTQSNESEEGFLAELLDQLLEFITAAASPALKDALEKKDTLLAAFAAVLDPTKITSATAFVEAFFASSFVDRYNNYVSDSPTPFKELSGFASLIFCDEIAAALKKALGKDQSPYIKSVLGVFVAAPFADAAAAFTSSADLYALIEDFVKAFLSTESDFLNKFKEYIKADPEEFILAVIKPLLDPTVLESLNKFVTSDSFVPLLDTVLKQLYETDFFPTLYALLNETVTEYYTTYDCKISPDHILRSRLNSAVVNENEPSIIIEKCAFMNSEVEGQWEKEGVDVYVPPTTANDNGYSLTLSSCYTNSQSTASIKQDTSVHVTGSVTQSADPASDSDCGITPETPVARATPEDKGFPGWAIALIVILVLLVIAAVVGVIIFFVLRSRSSSSSSSSNKDAEMDSDATDSAI